MTWSSSNESKKTVVSLTFHPSLNILASLHPTSIWCDLSRDFEWTFSHRLAKLDVRLRMRIMSCFWPTNLCSSRCFSRRATGSRWLFMSCCSTWKYRQYLCTSAHAPFFAEDIYDMRHSRLPSDHTRVKRTVQTCGKIPISSAKSAYPTNLIV